ncbi:MAG: zinc ABC transporter substrate-binding protein [Clostridia bacterium]
MKKLLLVICVILCLPCLTSCVGSDKPVVAVSILPLANFVRNICGDTVEIITLIPSGASPENYSPKPQTIAKAEDSLIYFAIGVPTEVANILPRLNLDNIVHLEEAVDAKYPDLMLGDQRDPHIWLSIKRAKVMVDTICLQMCKLLPINTDFYQQNAKEYLTKLDEVDKRLHSLLDNLIEKTFIVYHPAFAYLADDYGLTMLALEEDGKPATLEKLTQKVDNAKKLNIKVIFYQEEIDSSQAQTFADEIGGRAIKLSPLAEDYLANMVKLAEAIEDATK